MRKIVSLILACLTVVSMVACGTTETVNGWKIRNVSKPDLEVSIKETQFIMNGESYNDKVVVTPFAIDEAERAISAIQKLKCMQGWQVSISDSVYGMPIANPSVTLYQKGYRATFYQDAHDGETLTIEYLTDVDTFDGWSRIYVQWTTNQNNDPINQKHIFDVLDIVYNEFAEYMCYAYMNENDGYAIANIQSEVAAATLSREVCSSGVYFTFNMTSLVSGMTGNPGDVVYPVTQVKPFVTLLKWDEKEATLDNMQDFGHTFFQKFYGTTAQFQPITPYTFIKENNPLSPEGKRDREGFILIGKITDTCYVEDPELFYSCNRYSSGHYELTLRLDIAIEKAGPDKEEQIAELREYALQIVRRIEPDVTNECFSDNYRADIRLFEYEGMAKFRFYCDTDEDGNLSAELLIVASTNPEDFN